MVSPLSFIKAAIVAAFLFSLSSCQQTPVWCIEEHAPWINSKYHSSRIYLTTTEVGKTLELEVSRGSYGERIYLNCHLLPIKSKSAEANFTYLIGKQEWKGTALIFEGGQRLWIQEPDASTIVSALQQGQEITISIGMYKTTFYPDNFPILYGNQISQYRHF